MGLSQILMRVFLDSLLWRPVKKLCLNQTCVVEAVVTEAIWVSGYFPHDDVIDGGRRSAPTLPLDGRVCGLHPPGPGGAGSPLG